MTNRERILTSIEGAWRKKQIRTMLIAWGAVLAGLLLICLFSAFYTGGGLGISFEIFGILTAVFSAVFLPFVLFYVNRWRKLFHDCERYELHDAVLDCPGTSWAYRGAVYYTVSFRRASGETVKLDTMPLWSGAVFADNPLEKYNNKRIDLLYDWEGHRVIVLGLHN